MRRHLHRRRVERIRLFPPLRGWIDRVEVELDELSLDGARVRSNTALEVMATRIFSFEWDEERVDVEIEITRCRLDQRSRRYESGLRFHRPEGRVVAGIRRLIDAHVEEALEQQLSNAKGRPLTSHERASIARLRTSAPDRALLRMNEDRDRGFVRYSLTRGRWERSITWQNEQPDSGFTIWSFEESEHVDELCRIYAEADDRLRSLVRLCAELSLHVDDEALPPQYFDP
jgi:hypothetical protein